MNSSLVWGGGGERVGVAQENLCAIIYQYFFQIRKRTAATKNTCHITEVVPPFSDYGAELFFGTRFLVGCFFRSPLYQGYGNNSFLERDRLTSHLKTE